MGSRRDPFEAEIHDPDSFERHAAHLRSIDKLYLGRALTPDERAQWIHLRSPVLAALRAAKSWAPPVPLKKTVVLALSPEPATPLRAITHVLRQRYIGALT